MHVKFERAKQGLQSFRAGMIISHDSAGTSPAKTVMTTFLSFLLGTLINRVVAEHLPHEIVECFAHVPIPLRRRLVYRDLPTCSELFNVGA
jgi:hypothetical protein